ncbi:MAG: HAMP domain-containing sensor histidine kinase [Rickettsiales bacterium]|nr:HAMP domain-containing sensor histidine kinase [Rickettsiales bacterium]
MTNENLNPNLAQIQRIKSLAGSIAHETRNPLASIKQGCDIIKNCLDEAMEFLDLISTSSTRGLMISEMILANIREEKIDTNKFTDLSIAKIVKSAIREFAFESQKEKGLVNVDLEGDFIFKGDETLMIFVLFNLLKNSLYYKAKINIWLDADKKCLYFKDDGVGIPADKLELIFDDFFTSNKKGGTGLGLPFCKRVMLSFGGDISYKSVEGEGVEFCLNFPAY